MEFLKNKLLLNTLKITFAGLIFWALIHSSLLNFDLLAHVFQNPFLLLGLVGIFLSMVMVGALRWYLLNSAQQIPLGFKQSIKPTYIATAFNALLPGAVGGDFVRCYYVFKKIPDRKSTILLTIFFDRVIGLMGICLTLCLVGFMQMTFLSHQPELFYLIALTIGFCFALFAGLIALMVFPQRFGVQGWLEKKFPENKFAMLVVKYLETFRLYRVAKTTILQCLLLSVVIQCLLIGAIMLIAKMMFLTSIPFSHYAIAVGITLLVSLIPLTPGGVGVGEMAFANILLLLNPTATVAFATIYLAYRLLSMLTYLPAVIFYLPRFNLLRKKDLKLDTL